MRYDWKVWLLKQPRVNYWWRRWQASRGRRPGEYQRLFEHIRCVAPGRSFADIGCMWGVNGAHAFAAEEAGATVVRAVDVFGPTPEFQATHRARQSRVEFILGDCTSPETLARIGQVDVVFCAGVLYHHPSPFDVLVALRRMCRETLVLRTSTIPEFDGLPNAAIYFPMLTAEARQRWNLSSLGLLHQAGISNAFSAADGYGNWFWGLTPSCLVSLLETAGFAVDLREDEPFAQTIIARAVATPFDHRLPGEAGAAAIGAAVSASGVARPA